jgi:DhnA family fructose-bisphosphate aldolase class Ia
VSSQVGKTMRLKRVIDQAGVSVICALDHGMTSPTFLEPLADIATRTAEAVAGGANVIMMSKGMIRIAEPAFSPTTSLALLLSASANPEKGQPEVIQIAEVEEAARLGADAVVLFTALAGETEAGMIRTLAGVGRECAVLGIPFIAEAEFPTTYASVKDLRDQYGFEYLRRNVRLCGELGADIIKTNWPGDEESFSKLAFLYSSPAGHASRTTSFFSAWSTRWPQARSAARWAGTSSCTSRPRPSPGRCLA